MTEGNQESETTRRPSVGQMSFCSMEGPSEVNGYKNGVTNDNWITLNVGGKYFTTTKTTLKKDPKSFLARLASIDKNDVDQLNDLGSEKDETGAFLIDRSFTYFEFVLNYLRTNKLIYDNDATLQGITLEAEFYNIQSLISACKEKLMEKSTSSASLPSANTQPTYRVLQCSELDLTNTLSSLSDGWNFEQVTQLQNGTEKGNEYLLIISRRADLSCVNLNQGEKAKALHGYGSPQRR
jgi:hypothetical protein